MSTNEKFVFVCADESAKEEGVELPAEEDGTLLLSVLQSQYEGASGLKYRNPITGGWRAIKLLDGMLHPPDKEWGNAAYIVVLTATTNKPSAQQAEEDEEENQTEEKLDGAAGTGAAAAAVVEENIPSMGYVSDGYKRKLEDDEGQRASKNPRSQSPDNYPKPPSPSGHRNQEDLIILGLEWTVTDQELRTYFEQFGQVVHCEVKKDTRTGKSRGFGFVRYGDRNIQAEVFETPHTIKGRRVDLKYPKQSVGHLPNKLFVGCLPQPEVTNNELMEYFSQYGRITDVYVPRPYRGFGFVTFTDPVVAQKVVNMQHVLRKATLSVSFADPKGTPKTGGPYHSDPHSQLGYAAHMRGPRHPILRETLNAARYSYSDQQQQQAYSMGYDANQQASLRAMPTAVMSGLTSHSQSGIYSYGYANPTAHQQQQQPMQQARHQQTQQAQQHSQQQQQAYGQLSWPVR